MLRLQLRGTRLERFRQCGASLRLRIHRNENGACDDAKLTCFQCHDRFCQPCQRGVATRVRDQMKSLIHPADTRFITLTLRHSLTPLRDQIDRLLRSYKQLRRKNLWTEAVTAAAAFLEVKMGRDQKWHPHLHIIAVGHYMPHKNLSETWHAITGDSSIVHIEKIDNTDHAAIYVTKYLTKPIEHALYQDDAHLDEAILALKGRRMIITSGAWSKLKLRHQDKTADESGWENAPSLDTLFKLDHPDAERWTDVIRRRWPLLALVMEAKMRQRPPPIAEF